MPGMTDRLVSGLLSYIDTSPSPFHAVASARTLLEEHGYQPLDEGDRWELAPDGKYLVTRNDASLAAFHVGTGAPADAGFDLIGAHTDSPNLRLKPNPESIAHGYLQVGVEVYGGVLLSTWLDRDLGLAGRVFVERPDRGHGAHLVHIDRPMFRIPNLAIHLNRNVNAEGLKLNPQRHLPPIMGLEGEDAPSLTETLCSVLQRAGVEADEARLHSWDLGLCDTQPATMFGLRNEFVSAPRLDNLASCYMAVTALCRVSGPRARTRGIVLYDHEEVGSRSGQGAHSTFLSDVLGRLARARSPEGDALERAIARSMLISADMAHAVHPNYADKHDPNHRPRLGAGPVIKVNVSQAYASDGRSMARFRGLCEQADVVPQLFVSRADLACGSTIGPITAARLGLPTIDVGNPLLAMHSIRETAAAADVIAMQAVMDAYFG